jgi:hypothetical protein
MTYFVAQGLVTRLEQFKSKFESSNMLKIPSELLKKKTFKKNMIQRVFAIAVFTDLWVCCTFSSVEVLPTMQQKGEQVPTWTEMATHNTEKERSQTPSSV